MAVEDPAAFNAWVERLAETSSIDVGDNFDRYFEALRQRRDFFHSLGCRLSDHGLDTFYARDYAPTEPAAIFRRLRRGQSASTRTTPPSSSRPCCTAWPSWRGEGLDPAVPLRRDQKH